MEEASHLIAFKEDPEPRPPKAAQDGAVPAALLPAGAMPGMWHGRGRPWDVSSVWSGSTGRSSAVHVGDVALQERADRVSLQTGTYPDTPWMASIYSSIYI